MVALNSEQTKSGEEQTLKWRFNRFLERHMPEGLYTRSLIIIVAPMVLLQSIVAFTFMEKHWQKVTKRLSEAVSQDIAMLIDVYETYPFDDNYEGLIKMANKRLELSLSIIPNGELPPAKPKPFFSLLDKTLSKYLSREIGKPFWLDTVGRSDFVDIRIKVDKVIFQVIAKRSQAYAPSSEVFIIWMVGASLVLLTVAIMFLRNQIRPIQQLAEAARSFGMGRDVPDFQPRGAREVREASQSFINMRERIERHVEQRTAMLAGVSHDLRTILTRFRLQLAVFDDKEQAAALENDINEMQHMLEDYLAFARGDSGEVAQTTDVRKLLEDIHQKASHSSQKIELLIDGPLQASLKPNAFKRLVSNLVNNACKYAENVTVTGSKTDNLLHISIDDDGPGISPDMWEDVFRPFFRLDDARNLDHAGTGLGLAIALDIARSHGGNIKLNSSAMGGLQATIVVPV
jgi:two-component system, OmpR family, osmolarity sensor histidine kinase EnvZ